MHIDLQNCYAWFRLALSRERAFFFLAAMGGSLPKSALAGSDGELADDAAEAARALDTIHMSIWCQASASRG
ncbi:hypothetical protein RA280_33380 [Cupriavidus sp. CV2]|uniref:hypothetical protein n=1 Tax=Cupriavidus ulmosensis TaxID=3065913 RepID=UPI00296B339E|nr:hypothetical protein [Cupriavidus sp. CV2]MDW3686550.1 hypothetical protein [Cupriavidus sp. CV2]